MDDDKDHYWTLPTGSTKGSQSTVPAKATSPDRAGLNRSAWINKQARRVFASYRRDDFADPDAYAVNLNEVLSRYDDKVIEAVTSPVTGIQRTCKFPPSIAEFVEFIEDHIRRASFAATYDARSAKQLQEREEFERLEKAEPPEHRRKVVERVMVELKEKGFGTTKPAKQTWKRFSDVDLRAMYPAAPKAEEGNIHE